MLNVEQGQPLKTYGRPCFYFVLKDNVIVDK